MTSDDVVGCFVILIGFAILFLVTIATFMWLTVLPVLGILWILGK